MIGRFFLATAAGYYLYKKLSEDVVDVKHFSFDDEAYLKPYLLNHNESERLITMVSKVYIACAIYGLDGIQAEQMIKGHLLNELECYLESGAATDLSDSDREQVSLFSVFDSALSLHEEVREAFSPDIQKLFGKVIASCVGANTSNADGRVSFQRAWRVITEFYEADIAAGRSDASPETMKRYADSVKQLLQLQQEEFNSCFKKINVY